MTAWADLVFCFLGERVVFFSFLGMSGEKKDPSAPLFNYKFNFHKLKTSQINVEWHNKVRKPLIHSLN